MIFFKIKLIAVITVWSIMCLWLGFSFGTKVSFNSLQYVHLDTDLKYDQDENIKFSHWSGIETTHRWSLGKNSFILFKPNFNYSDDNSYVTLKINVLMSVGEQEIHLYLNDKYIETKRVNGSNIIEYKIDKSDIKNKEQNEIRLYLPNAKQANDIDSRELGIALESLIFEEGK